MTVRRLIIFTVKRLSEGPYLKSFIRRVRSKHRERFSSFSRYCTRLHVEVFFLLPLHRGVGTKAVNNNSSVSEIFGLRMLIIKFKYLLGHEGVSICISSIGRMITI